MRHRRRDAFGGNWESGSWGLRRATRSPAYGLAWPQVLPVLLTSLNPLDRTSPRRQGRGLTMASRLPDEILDTEPRGARSAGPWRRSPRALASLRASRAAHHGGRPPLTACGSFVEGRRIVRLPCAESGPHRLRKLGTCAVPGLHLRDLGRACHATRRRQLFTSSPSAEMTPPLSRVTWRPRRRGDGNQGLSDFLALARQRREER